MTVNSAYDSSDLVASAERVRANCVRLDHNAGSGGAHFGPALSLVEIMVALYSQFLDVAPERSHDPERDRLILSKGHGSLALYATLHEFGFIPSEVLDRCETDGSPLPGQLIRNLDFGIEFSSGSLGMGLSFGVGLALSARMSASAREVVVIMGDGETNEGSAWEAAMSAAHFGLQNLTAVVDINGLQSDGPTAEVIDFDHSAAWRGFGWDVVEVVDGHDLEELIRSFSQPKTGKPRVVLARTVKGKGIEFMENVAEWHHGRMSDAQAEQAMRDAGAS